MPKARANKFVITACDNELILIAYTASASFHICTIKSGKGSRVEVTIPIVPGQYQGQIALVSGAGGTLHGTYPVELNPGTYCLAAIGIDWGGSQRFDFTLNETTYSLPHGEQGSGVVWLGGAGVAPPPHPITFTV